MRLIAGILCLAFALAGCASSFHQRFEYERQGNAASNAKNHAEAGELFLKSADAGIDDLAHKTPYVEGKDPFFFHKGPEETYLVAANNFKLVDQIDKAFAAYARCLERMVPIGGGERCEIAAQQLQTTKPTLKGQELMAGQGERAALRAKGKQTFLAAQRDSARKENAANARREAEENGEDYGAQANLNFALGSLFNRSSPAVRPASSAPPPPVVAAAAAPGRASVSNGVGTSPRPASSGASTVAIAQSQPLINPNDGSSYSAGASGASCSMQGPRSAQTDKCRCETIHKGRFFVRNDSWYCADASGGHIFGCSAGGSSCSIR